MPEAPRKKTDEILCPNFNVKVPVAIEAEKITCLGCGEEIVAELAPHGDEQAISCWKYGHLAPIG